MNNNVASHNDMVSEKSRVAKIHADILSGKRTIYSFWFSGEMSHNRKMSIDCLRLNCRTDFVLLDSDGFYKYERPEMPIHPGFEYLIDVHKADYARVYMMYFYGGGYSDIKPNSFDWNPYFDKLFTSEYDIIGYSEKSPWDIAEFYSDKEKDIVFDKYDSFIANGHYIFKPKTNMAYEWISEIHTLMDERYVDLSKNILSAIHVKDPDYADLTKNYPFGWNELLGRIFHKLQYKNDFKDFIIGMPYTNNVNYR